MILYNVFQMLEAEALEILPNSFYQASITLIFKQEKDSARKENYRPLSLMNININIFNKILVNQI